MRTQSFLTAKARMNWDSELQIAVFKTFGPLASLDIHNPTSGTEQDQSATTTVWNISMAFLLRKKLFRKMCEKHLPILACWSVLRSLQNAGVQSHLRFWYLVSQFWCATKNINGCCSQRTMREDTIRIPLLLTNSLFFGARWCVHFLNPYQCG